MNLITQENTIKQLEAKLKDISDRLTKGDYSVRLDLDTDDEILIRLKNSLNQILELMELNLDISLIGDDSILNKFIDVFSCFANRQFTKKLEISEKGTILDALGAGINMLGEELEFSTVSKNELEIERNRLDESQRIAKIGDWEFYPGNNKFICSKTFYSVLEIEPDNYMNIYNNVKSKLFPEDVDDFCRHMESIETIPYTCFEIKIISESSSVKYFLNIINHIYDSYGNTIGYKGILQDISTIKESQLKLEYQTSLEKLIADISTNFIKLKPAEISISIEKVLQECSVFFKADRTYFFKFSGDENDQVQIFEWNDEKINYSTIGLLNDSPELFELCINAAKSKEIIQINDINSLPKHEEAEKKMLIGNNVKSFLIIPVYSNDDEFSIFGMDCVSIKRSWSEEEINGLKIISNIISDAINRDYFEKNLIIARENAEESDRLKSAFLANMSHEIRTPMNGILGFAELLKLPNLSGEKQKEFINLIGKSGERMLNTIDDLINISKLESGQTKVTYSNTDIEEMMSYMYGFFRPEADKKGLKLSCSSTPENAKTVINTDKEKVYAILTNLIKNAIKFTKTGSVEFGYNFNTDIIPSELQFYIKDTGIGITQNKHKSVFDRFVQGDLSLNRGYEGSGLGLSISKAYVEMLGGKIWLESEPDVGTQFFFTIPANVETDNSDTFVSTNFISFKNEKIDATVLLAENDEDTTKFMVSVLKNFCSGFLTAKTGEEAVNLCLKNSNIDLVLMDIKMPLLDGYEAAQIIKEFRPDLPIIAQTAFAMEEEKAKYGNIFNDYLTKPVKIDVLKQAIILALNNSKTKL